MGGPLSRGLPLGCRLEVLLTVSFASQNVAEIIYVREITNDQVNTLESNLGTIL
jgi:hypothetical protein